MGTINVLPEAVLKRANEKDVSMETDRIEQ